MNTIETILVHIPEALENVGKNNCEITEEEKQNYVIEFAESIAESLCGSEIDSYKVIDEGYDEFPKPILFANDDWNQFVSYLERCDKRQKSEAGFLLEFLEKQTGTTDLKQLLSDLLLSHNRNASIDEIAENSWKYDYLSEYAVLLKKLSHLIKGTFIFESGFYDSYRNTSLVPYYTTIKENAKDWALVFFDCHG